MKHAHAESMPLSTLPLFDICERRHGGNPQSSAAHKRAAGHKCRDLVDVLERMRSAGADGLTCKEYCAAQGRAMHEVSGRFSDAKRLGCARVLRDGSDRPVTRGGCAALVFVKMPDGK